MPIGLFAPEQITLAVLAGGEGSRMGRPKGNLTLHGKPILQDLLDRLAWPGPAWLITAPGREHPPGWERFDRELTDPCSDAGPLRGVMTALESLQTPLAAIVTVDMPGIGSEQIEWLIAQWSAKQVIGVMCRRMVGDQPAIEPFPLVLSAEAAPCVRKRLETGRRSVHGLLEEPGMIDVPAPTHWEPGTWANLNQPSDLAQFERTDGG